MTLIEQYFTYLRELADGSRTPPEGVVLTEKEPMRRAAELQAQIQEIGVPEFVRRCAAQDGRVLPDEVYAAYREDELRDALAGMLAPDEPPQIDEPEGRRSAYEVLLDCCCLDENLLYYLIDVLKRGAEEEFQKLALVTARKAFTRADLLYWFATKPDRAPREEQVCVALMDACFDRLAAEGRTELIAALLCGDRTTFELFRCDALELCHLPDATFDWYDRNYLQGYYAIRYLLKYHKIAVPNGKERT